MTARDVTRKADAIVADATDRVGGSRSEGGRVGGRDLLGVACLEHAPLNTTSVPRPRAAGLAVTCTASRMFWGPSASTAPGRRIAPVTTTGRSLRTVRSRNQASSSSVSVPPVMTMPATSGAASMSDTRLREAEPVAERQRKTGPARERLCLDARKARDARRLRDELRSREAAVRLVGDGAAGRNQPHPWLGGG